MTPSQVSKFIKVRKAFILYWKSFYSVLEKLLFCSGKAFILFWKSFTLRLKLRFKSAMSKSETQ